MADMNHHTHSTITCTFSSSLGETDMRSNEHTSAAWACMASGGITLISASAEMVK